MNLNLLLIVVFSIISIAVAIFDSTYKHKTRSLDLLCSAIIVICAIVVGINLANLV